MAFCSKCGSPLPPDARFCANCGAAFQKQQANPQDGDFSAPQRAQTSTAQSAPVSTPPSYEAPPATQPAAQPYTQPYTQSYTYSYEPPRSRRVMNMENASRLHVFIASISSLLLKLVISIGCSVAALIAVEISLDIENSFSALAVYLSIPALFMTGILIIRAQGSKTGYFATGGFSMISIVSIITAVFLFLFAFAFQVTSFNSDSESAIIPLVSFSMAVVCVLGGIAFIMLSTLCSKFKRYLYDIETPRPSGFLVVCFWIIGITLALLSVMGIFSINFSRDMAYRLSLILFLVCIAGSCIVTAVLLRKLRQEFPY